jgi:uncharacterized protein (DUF1015 family)
VATIRPFRALRPKAELVEKVSCVPHDVVSKAEAREFVAHNPLSFLRVTRPRSEFTKGNTPALPQLFERAKTSLERLIHDGVLIRDPEAAVFVYRLSAADHVQTGIAACCSLDEYEAGTIKKHENVRPDKVAERAGHILALRAQTGLIFLAFRGTDEIRRLIAESVERGPVYDFVSPDGIRQQVWRVTETGPFVAAFGEVESIYIADGHHRIEGARLVRERLRAENPSHDGSEEYNYVMAGLFPAEDLRIRPYNRVVCDLNGLSEAEFFAKLSECFTVTDTQRASPMEHGEICMYLGDKWHDLRFWTECLRETDPIHGLDVSILQDHLLGPLLGIIDPTTDDRVGFIGGACGTEELERAVDSGEAVAAFSLYPTTMDDLLTVSDMGEVMPPKSTWFEPKLKDGLLVHEI